MAGPVEVGGDDGTGVVPLPVVGIGSAITFVGVAEGITGACVPWTATTAGTPSILAIVGIEVSAVDRVRPEGLVLDKGYVVVVVMVPPGPLSLT